MWTRRANRRHPPEVRLGTLAASSAPRVDGAATGRKTSRAAIWATTVSVNRGRTCMPVMISAPVRPVVRCRRGRRTDRMTAAATRSGEKAGGIARIARPDRFAARANIGVSMGPGRTVQTRIRERCHVDWWRLRVSPRTANLLIEYVGTTGFGTSGALDVGIGPWHRAVDGPVDLERGCRPLEPLDALHVSVGEFVQPDHLGHERGHVTVGEDDPTWDVGAVGGRDPRRARRPRRSASPPARSGSRRHATPPEPRAPP